MFKYAQEDLEEKIKVISENVAKLEIENLKYEGEISTIQSYRNALYDIKEEKIKSLFCLGFILLLVIVSTLMHNSKYGLSIGILMSPIIFVQINRLIISKKEMQDRYRTICNLSDEEMDEKIARLKVKQKETSTKMQCLLENKKTLMIQLEKIEKFKKTLSSYQLPQLVNPYYRADTKEEYDLFVKQKQKLDNIIEYAIKESNDFRIIKNNQIAENIGYKEKCKQFVKKI